MSIFNFLEILKNSKQISDFNIKKFDYEHYIVNQRGKLMYDCIVDVEFKFNLPLDFIKIDVKLK